MFLVGSQKALAGIFAIYKPKGPTSNEVLTQLKKICGIKKIGHAGTLDPLASGVLVVGIGREATKRLAAAVAKEKEYLAKIKLGEESATDDAEGEKKKIDFSKKPELAAIKKAVKNFVGEIYQAPPVFSAVKIKGREAYKLARRGERPAMPARKVLIKKIEILKYQWPFLELRVITGPGVYIRALARDLGKILGGGGYLAELERTRVGDYTTQNSITMEQFKELFNHK